MLVIGMTGGIGCGKSHVCKYLKAHYDAEIILTDDVANEICEPGGRVYDEVKALLGDEYYNEDGTRNRALIGNRAFREPELLEQMNAIIHPAVRLEVEDRLAAAAEEGKEVAVVEAALLIEAGYRDLCTEYWYVYASEETRIERLLASRPITVEKIKDVMARQLTEEEFRAGRDFTVDNDGDTAYTDVQVDARMKFLFEQVAISALV